MSESPKSSDRSAPRPGSTYRRLLAYVRPYVSRLAIGVVAGVVAGAAMGGGVLKLLRDNLDNLTHTELIAAHEFFLTIALLPLLIAILGLAEYISAYYIEWVGNRVVQDVRSQTFAHLHDLSLAYFNKQKTGELISRTVNDSTLLERSVSAVLADLAKQPVTFVCALGYIIYLDWRLALCSFIIVPISIVPVLHFGKRVRRHGRQGQEHMAGLVTILQETISGIRIVKAFGMEQREVERFDAEGERYFHRIVRIVRAKAGIQPLIQFVATLGFVALWVYCYYAKMPVADVITFGIGLFIMYKPAKKLGGIHLQIEQSSSAADRIFEILDTEAAVTDRPAARPLEGPVARIECDQVTFAYERDPVLQEVSFTVDAGRRIAFVGGSGAGKTTLINLLPRFYDVTSGAIRINGTDIRDYTVASLRANIGMVTQDTILFHDTVRNNIAYGRSDATQAEVETAARRAHAHEFIADLPEGYDSVVGDRGMRLSGGQKQRLSIARALLKDAPILILDEATSALDTESERLVQAALEELMTDRTVFVIAHRLSTIVNADRILVLDAGRVVEEGTHDELLAMGGAYRRLYSYQFEDTATNA